jgi:hypothetical protein
MRTVISLLVLSASVVMSCGCASSNPASAPRACKVAKLTLADMDKGAVNAKAMRTYAAALADIGTTGPLASPVTAAVRAADTASSDADQADWTDYKAAGSRLVAELQVIRGDCLRGVT